MGVKKCTYNFKKLNTLNNKCKSRDTHSKHWKTSPTVQASAVPHSLEASTAT